MIIKSINNVVGYKGLPDGFKMDFDEKLTYIIGDNAKTKSTILEVPFYTLTGYNLTGSDRDHFKDINRPNLRSIITDITIIDNEGRERNIVRSKGKENYILVDGLKTTQKDLSSLFDYRDVHIFTCAYNPYYFRSLEQAKQRELLVNLLPSISPNEAFNLLDNMDKETLGGPIVDIKGYCENKRADKKLLTKEIDTNNGKIEIYQKNALIQEGEILEFTEATELEYLEKKYEELLNSSDSNINISELETSIRSLEQRLDNLLKFELEKIKVQYTEEVGKLNNIKSSKSICPNCKQEVKNEKTIERLSLYYSNNINNLKDKMNTMKNDVKSMMDLRKVKIEEYNKLKTPEMQNIEFQRKDMKKRLEELKNKQQEIIAHNKEVQMKSKGIKEAKNMLDILKKANQEILADIDKIEMQLKAADRLKRATIQAQLNNVKEYLDKVTIDFSIIDERTGELKDVYIVKYNGVEYKDLSKSYKMRADFEIANLISRATKINSPMIIDDAESITNIKSIQDLQVIVSLVVKHSDLEVLYDYQEVLKKFKNSIDMQINLNQSLMLEQVA